MDFKPTQMSIRLECDGTVPVHVMGYVHDVDIASLNALKRQMGIADSEPTPRDLSFDPFDVHVVSFSMVFIAGLLSLGRLRSIQGCHSGIRSNPHERGACLHLVGDDASFHRVATSWSSPMERKSTPKSPRTSPVFPSKRRCRWLWRSCVPASTR